MTPKTEALFVALLAGVLLCGALTFYDNTTRGTTNGLWKSIDVAPWVERTPDRKTEDSNLLYYPAIGTLVRLLPADAFGPVWRRMAFVNVLFASGVLALTYLIAFRLFESRSAAWFTALSHGAAAFFLLLSTINEDIMPGYAWFMAAVACAVVPRRLSPWAIALAAQCVALSWLFHSSLQLPAIASLIAGIAAAAPDRRRAVRQGLLFCACLIPLPIIAALLSGIDWQSGVWSGKGLGTGWGGLSVNKVLLMWSGIAQYVAGGQNVASVDAITARPYAIWVALTWVLIAVLAVVFIRECRRQSDRREWRMAAAVFGTAFLTAEAMNLYIQPQDPQMQLQPMTWFPFAAGAAFWTSERAVSRPRARLAVRGALTLAAMGLLAVNVDAYAGDRNGDSVALANVHTLERLAEPSQTVFLVHGFEGMTTWLTASWGRGAVWPHRETPAPLDRSRRFHAIYIAAEGIEFPERSPEKAAADVVRLVSRALDEGFDVVATDIWAGTEEQWARSFDTIARPEKAHAIRTALYGMFTGVPIGSIAGWGNFYRISPKAEPLQQP